MKKWHITITENETESTPLEFDTDAIIAAISGDNGAHAVCMTHCNAISLSGALYTLQKTIEEQKKLNPIVAALMAVGSAAAEMEETTEEATNE